MESRSWDWHLEITGPEASLYLAHLKAGQIALGECAACGNRFHYPRSLCPRCWSDRWHWRFAEGGGTIYSFTVVRRQMGTPHDDIVPFAVALVDLDEGPRMLARVVEAEPGALGIGQRVRLRVLKGPDERPEAVCSPAADQP